MEGLDKRAGTHCFIAGPSVEKKGVEGLRRRPRQEKYGQGSRNRNEEASIAFLWEKGT